MALQFTHEKLVISRMDEWSNYIITRIQYPFIVMIPKEYEL